MTRQIAIGFLGSLALILDSLYALDTTEPFDIGFTDFEMAGCLNGLGEPRGEKELGWEGVVGVGLTESFSASFSYSLSSNEFLNGDGTDKFALGLFASLFTYKMLSLDLVAGISTGGAIDLGTEINLDVDRGGFQLTLNESLSYQEDLGNTRSPGEIASHTLFEPLLYVNFGSRVQLLTAMDFAIHHSSTTEQENFETGDFKLGCNITLSDAIEVLPELSIGIPSPGEKATNGFTLKFISTLPAGK